MPDERVKEGSRPSRARGLKHVAAEIGRQRHDVAPLTGAWIETQEEEKSYYLQVLSRPSRARGLKQLDS